MPSRSGVPARPPVRRRRHRGIAEGRAVIRVLAALAVVLPLAAAAQEAPLRPVKLMTLQSDTAQMRRQFFGRVRARETVDLAFQVGGQIVDFPVAEGTTLERGTRVAALDLTPFERGLKQAKVNLDKAQRDLNRLQELSGSAVSAVEIRDARTQVELAEIDVADARDALEDATLTTSFEALVARREAATYSTVAAGEPVVRLHDMSELRVDIDVPEVLFRRAAGRDEVEFNACFPGDERNFPLVLREFEAETAEVAQTFTLTLAFVGEVPGWVLPGASVTVNAMAPRPGREDTATLPETAVIFDAEGDPGVMVFSHPEEDPSVGTVEWRPIEMELRDDARLAMTEGPEMGTEIVAAGASQLKDGQRVRRFTGLGN